MGGELFVSDERSVQSRRDAIDLQTRVDVIDGSGKPLGYPNFCNVSRQDARRLGD